MLSWTLEVEESNVPLFFFYFRLFKIKYGLFVFFAILSHVWRKTWKSQNHHISFKTVRTRKNKGTLFSSTFKVQESKLPYFFRFLTVLNEIWPFCVFKVHPQCWRGGGFKSHLEAILEYRLLFFWLLMNIGRWPKKLKIFFEITPP